MLRRHNTGWRDGQLSLVAGHAHPGEDIVSAAIRETYEEVGVKMCRTDLAPVGMLHRSSDDAERIDVFFDALSWKGTPRNREPHKASELLWIAECSLPREHTVDYIYDALTRRYPPPWIGVFGWATP
jgi:8-oxo-dGTP pyrophosphatase MutT (NUDIX family)